MPTKYEVERVTCLCSSGDENSIPRFGKLTIISVAAPSTVRGGVVALDLQESPALWHDLQSIVQWRSSRLGEGVMKRTRTSSESGDMQKQIWRGPPGHHFAATLEDEASDFASRCLRKRCSWKPN